MSRTMLVVTRATRVVVRKDVAHSCHDPLVRRSHQILKVNFISVVVVGLI